MGFRKDKYGTKIRNDFSDITMMVLQMALILKKNTWFCLDDTCNKVKVGPG